LGAVVDGTGDKGINFVERTTKTGCAFADGLTIKLRIIALFGVNSQ